MLGFVHGPVGEGCPSETGAGEDPSLAWCQRLVHTAPVGNPPEQQLVDGAGWRTVLAIDFSTCLLLLEFASQCKRGTVGAS